jgi:SAM-dependent methyltransferase
MHDFDRDYEHTQRLFRRLKGRVTLQGKTVLDVGCGTGPTCVYAGLHGARRVLGVDIVATYLAFARSKLATDYPELVGVVEYCGTRGDLEELGTEQFDVIISQNSFEHYSDPEGVVATIKRLLAENGVLVLAFAPLWKSPYGGHITFMTQFPWAHLLFPEHIVMSERRRLIPSEDARRYEDAIGGLNRMTLKRFRDIMRASDLECLYFDTNVSEKWIMKLARVASRVRLLEEFFTHNVYSIWRLRGGSAR